MRVKKIINKKYNDKTDIGLKVNSTSICLLYDNLIRKNFPNLSFSKAKSISNNILNIEVTHNLEAQEIKLYEFDIKAIMNDNIHNPKYVVDKLNIKVNSL